MGSPSVVRGSRPQGAVAAFTLNQWQRSPGMGGSFAMESVATFVWNSRQRWCGIGGSFGVEYAITQEVKRGGDIYLFQHVPAKVCTARGEMWIDEEVLQVIDRLIESGVPARKVETPVYDYPRAIVPAR